jgi:hypothetical protein
VIALTSVRFKTILIHLIDDLSDVALQDYTKYILTQLWNPVFLLTPGFVDAAELC